MSKKDKKDKKNKNVAPAPSPRVVDVIDIPYVSGEVFDTIVSTVESNIIDAGYEQVQSSPADLDGNRFSVYKKDEVAYGIVFDSKKHTFTLQKGTYNDGEVGESWATSSQWLWSSTNTPSDMNDIANDFIKVINYAPKKVAIASRVANPASKGASTSTSCEVMIKRLLHQNKDAQYDYRDHIDKYGQLLPDIFVKEHICPFIVSTFRTGSDKQKSRLIDSLNSLYNTGDDDVKSVITFTMLAPLREVKNADISADAEALMNPSLKSVYRAMKRVAKPEKVEKLMNKAEKVKVKVAEKK